MTPAIKRKRQLSDRAKEVKKELINQEMSQRELAEKLGMNENYLTAVLSGRRAGGKYWTEIEKILVIKQN